VRRYVTHEYNTKGELLKGFSDQFPGQIGALELGPLPVVDSNGDLVYTYE
jgi:hypothetical protein